MQTQLNEKSKRLKKINFGSGWDKKPDYLNVDIDKTTDPDLLVSNGDYSAIPRDYYEEILANDVLEHISHVDTMSVILEWSDFLKNGGKLHIRTSSILDISKQLKKNRTFEHQIGWALCLFGNQAHVGDFHHIGFTESILRTHLMAAGFEVDRFELKDLWLFHVECHKSYDWKDMLQTAQRFDDEAFINSIFMFALGRKPDELGRGHIQQSLKTQDMSREDALRHLMKSRERLYYTAREHGI